MDKENMYFLGFRAFTNLWKKLVLLSPSFNQRVLASCFQWISFLKTKSCSFSFVALYMKFPLWKAQHRSLFCLLGLFHVGAFVFCGMMPNVLSFFHNFILALIRRFKMDFLFGASRWHVFGPPIWYVQLESLWWSHMFSNLKGVRPPSGRKELTREGKLSEADLGKPMRLVLGIWSSILS